MANIHDKTARHPMTAIRIARRVIGSSTSHSEPCTALNKLQGIINTQSIASSTPAGLARAAETNSPRTKCENAVVIPHPGHGRENRTRMEHSGNPNCWCVPKPLGSGSNIRATAKPLRRNMAQASKMARVTPPRGAPFVGLNRFIN